MELLWLRVWVPWDPFLGLGIGGVDRAPSHDFYGAHGGDQGHPVPKPSYHFPWSQVSRELLNPVFPVLSASSRRNTWEMWPPQSPWSLFPGTGPQEFCLKPPALLVIMSAEGGYLGHEDGLMGWGRTYSHRSRGPGNLRAESFMKNKVSKYEPLWPHSQTLCDWFQDRGRVGIRGAPAGTCAGKKGKWLQQGFILLQNRIVTSLSSRSHAPLELDQDSAPPQKYVICSCCFKIPGAFSGPITPAQRPTTCSYFRRSPRAS